MARSRPALGVGAGLAAIAVVALVVPLIVIGNWDLEPGVRKEVGAAGAVVAIGAVFRAGARSVLRMVMGTSSRTAARTISRRFTRVFVKSGASVAKSAAVDARGGDSADPTMDQPLALALGLGFAGLALSYTGVLWLVEPEVAVPLTHGMPVLLAGCVGASPVLIYYAVLRVVASMTGAEVGIRTGFDGLLLQGYFTGAASFLPLTSDISYSGDAASRARCATTVLVVLLGVHLAFDAVGKMLGVPFLVQYGGLVLLYGFVYSFPLQPLDGAQIWAQSKLRWAVVWVFVLGAFAVNLPEELNGIL